MSTVGKVLCVLVILPALAWIWLAAGVAEMNRNWGKTVDSLDASIKQAAIDIASTAEEVDRLKFRIGLAQRERDSRLALMRGQLSHLYRYESVSKESQDRNNFQLASAQGSVEAAERRYAKAEQILRETQQLLATARSELETLRQENERDRNHLADLRQRFEQLLAENTALVEDMLRSGSATSDPLAAPTASR